MSRLKRVLIVLGSVAAVLIAAIGGGFLWLYADAKVSTAGSTEFTRELAIPPLAQSTVRADGTRVFDLTMRAGRKEFEPGKQTPTWGFNGDYLGPTLRAERGEKVAVRIKNTLDEASTVHWHGMHLPAKMDGGPHQMVAPGGSWTPNWTVDQPASTLWYHPHPHGATEKHVQRGLAGMFLLDDARSKGLALPRTYGVDDLPVVVQDVKFDGATFDHGHGLMASVGFLGDRTMVNGTPDPYKQVGDERIRLRLLNASTARVYTFGFDDDRRFALIGTDGGLLERPASMDRVRLSPGERAEIVVTMKPGERTVLRSYPLDAGLDFWNQRFSGGDDSFDVLQLRAAATLRPSPDVPARLGELEVPDGKDTVRGRHFDLRMSGINGRSMEMSRIDETVTRGTSETWTVRNDNGMPHNFHVHDVQFRVLEVDGEKPPAELLGAKDTVYLPSGTTMKLAMRFDGPADPDTPYMYHCHLLYHEDAGMMGQFVVVEKGQQAGKVRTPHAHAWH
ncbi:multicopper oxidase family protein [Streptomyces vilmorinianum]|uniref:multicopper oxidase family protein n=1 Tax=Streptomyces vilmorinianum TaxID=3051092 RepID=UPI0010FBA2E1|nr:multicopper oxidase domain-containing protein [Streptomyces vilmorinianum]